MCDNLNFAGNICFSLIMCIDFFYQEFAVLDPKKEKVFTNEERLKFLQVLHDAMNYIGCNCRLHFSEMSL